MNFDGLNEVQKEAAVYTGGPCLIIAGAGSGKTRVITCKIAYLLERGADPASIMALTFTNKAAKEMRERIAAIVGGKKAFQLKMGTFHSIFARILRQYSGYTGFPRSFTIYDASDSKNAVKQCIRELQLDDKIYKPGEVLSRISIAKNYLVDAASYRNDSETLREDMRMRRGKICDVYSLYAAKCAKEGIMDFDDILLYMNKLLKNNPSVAEELRRSVRYILVDEYQDTNLAQYHILKMLSAKHRNITVVGDDSQSIYAFRGARIQNIFNFRKDYPEAKEFRLEQNYRSTQTIVNAANSLILHNSNRLKKECFSEGEEGAKIEILGTYSDMDEAASVVSHIMKTIYATKASYDSFAILYRTNAQSRQFEEALRRRNIPYKIYAGHSFYDRREIKDVLAYMRLILNGHDNDAFRRAINFPSRGIGSVTLERLQQAASGSGLSLLETAGRDDLEKLGIKGAVAARLRSFVSMINGFSEKAAGADAAELADSLLKQAGIIAALNADQSPEGISRKENVMELLNGIGEFVEDERETAAGNESEERFPSLELYMENVALLTDTDEKEEKEDTDRVKLMTLHSSKGLEFPYIYIAGMEENLFPSAMSSFSSDKLEEERRLFYVGMTRAEKSVTLSYAESRWVNGQIAYSSPSRFLKEIDRKYIRDSSKLYKGEALKTPPAAPFPHLRKLDSRASFSAASDSSVNSAASEIYEGDRVVHSRFGTGKVLSVSGGGSEAKAVVEFDNLGVKTLLLKYAKLQKI